MLDLKFIRENTDLVRQALENRRDTAPIDDILRLDTQRRQKIMELEDLRRQRKETARDRKMDEDTLKEGRVLRDAIRILEEEVGNLENEMTAGLLQVPNIPQADTPVGQGEEDNVIVRTWGEPKSFDFTPVPHWKLGESLGIIDFERGVKLSGSRFYVLKGMGARLQRALIWFMVDLHTGQHGYNEVYLPFMVKRECMVGASNLPKFADNLYHDDTDDFWFVPTAEVPLTNLHRDEIIPAGLLPFPYVAYTACFRRE